MFVADERNRGMSQNMLSWRRLGGVPNRATVKPGRPGRAVKPQMPSPDAWGKLRIAKPAMAVKVKEDREQ